MFYSIILMNDAVLRIFVSPDNPEHYVMKFINGDINRLDYKTNQSFVSNAVEGVITNSYVSEDFYVSSFSTMTLHNYVRLPGDGFYQGPDSYTYNELRENINTKLHAIDMKLKNLVRHEPQRLCIKFGEDWLLGGAISSNICYISTMV